MQTNIPSVNLLDFLSDDPKRKQRFVEEIGQAYESIGFVSLAGHFLTKEMSATLYEQIKLFFGQDDSVKSQYEIEGTGGQRGYTSFGKEHAKGKAEGDLKEFWHFGQYLPDDLKSNFDYPENVFVEELPEFNAIGEQVFKALEKTGIYVLRALALHLSLDENYFDDKVKHGNSILRPIHYPPITTEPKGAVRAAAHGDINLITLLMGASTGGLQVLDKDHNWLDAKPREEELVINVGDMLSRHTNNKLKSTIHRVVNPPREEWGNPRYSIPFFMHPISEMDLSCLSNCIDEAKPKRYEDINAGDFLTQRLREIGLIK